MKNLSAFLTLILFSLSLSTASYASPPSKKDLPKTILIKRDQNGEFFVHRSNVELPKEGANLDGLKWERLADAKGVNIKNIPSETDELDQDRPRQSWYLYWGYGYGYYPYYPIYYNAYAYNYAYYPYYSYYGGGCNYYWYGYGGYNHW